MLVSFIKCTRMNVKVLLTCSPSTLLQIIVEVLNIPFKLFFVLLDNFSFVLILDLVFRHSLEMFQHFLTVRLFVSVAKWQFKNALIVLSSFAICSFANTEITYNHHVQYNSNRSLRHNAIFQNMPPLSKVHRLVDTFKL
jgi:hypothetical protein